jgi:hypothetical protein
MVLLEELKKLAPYIIRENKLVIEVQMRFFIYERIIRTDVFRKKYIDTEYSLNLLNIKNEKITTIKVSKLFYKLLFIITK